MGVAVVSCSSTKPRKASEEKEQLGVGALKAGISTMLVVYRVRESAKQGLAAPDSIVLEDPGSTHNIIANQLTRDIGLTSKQITTMVKATERQHKLHQTEAYNFNLMDAQGTKQARCQRPG